MKKTLGIFIGVALLASASLVGIVLIQSKGSMTLQNESADRISDESEARYAFQIETKVKTKGEGEKTLLALEGTLVQTRQDASDTLTEWSDISSFILSDKPADPALVSAMLNKAFITSRESDGSLNHYVSEQFPKELLTMQLNFLQKLFLPVDIKSTQPLVRNEKDETGFFSVQYSFKPQENRISVTRTFLQSLGANMKVDGTSNVYHYVVEDNGRLISLSGDFTLHMFEPSAKSYSTRISVVLKGTDPASDAKKKVAKNTLKRLDFGGRTVSNPENGDGALMSMAEALKAVDTFMADATPREDFTVFQNLTNALHKDPTQLQTVVDKILSIKERDDNSKRRLTMLFTVLADSDTKEGADALADLAGPKCTDEFCKDQSMMAYNFHSNPSEPSASKMISIAETTTDPVLSSTAYLAAGSAGAKLPNSSAEITSSLLNSVANPQKAEIKTSIIAAMGNHASPDYVPVLKEGTASADYQVRAASVYSLRNIPSEAVNSLILDVVQKETDLYAQKEALKALSARNLTDKEYEQVAQKGLTYQEDVQTDAARLLLEAYWQNPSNAGAALNTLKNGSQFQVVKTYIDEEIKRANESKLDAVEDEKEGGESVQ